MTQDSPLPVDRTLLVEWWGDGVGFGLFRIETKRGETTYFVARRDLNFGEGPDDYQESVPNREPYEALEAFLPRSGFPFLVVTSVSDFEVAVGLNFKYLVVDLRKIRSVTNLLDEVWTSGRFRASKYSYGVEWTLVNSRTGRVLEHARMGNPGLQGKPVTDSRLLSDVGIQPGDVLFLDATQRGRND